MFNNNAIASYKKISLDTAIMSASPHQLINMLFNGVKESLSTIKYAMKTENIALRGEATSKAINIITNGLVASLDYEQGGELAFNLNDLYQYMSFTLINANIKNDLKKVEEVDRLIEEIHSAWRAIEQNVNSTVQLQ